MHKILFASHPPWTLAKGRWRGLEFCEESGVCGFGEGAWGTAARIPVLNHSSIQQMPFSPEGSTPLCVALAYKNTIDPLSGLPFTLPYEVYTLLRSQLPWPECRH